MTENNEKPLLSVFMPAYNHGRFVAQALDGVFSQKTDFPFQVIVCDDFSTDNTRQIVDEYAEEHPNLIRSYQPMNSRGANNLIDGLKLVNTKYMAMCECDDYWTNPHKLQRQVDFLEKNPDFMVSAHRVKIVYEEGVPHTAGSYVYKDIKSDIPRIRRGEFTAMEALSNYYFHTSSLVFRWLFSDGLPPWFAKRMTWDHFLFMLHADKGMIKYFDVPMSCWRHHSKGWTFLQNIDKNIFFFNKNDAWNGVYSEMNKFFNYRYSEFISERTKLSIKNTLEYCLKHNEIDRLRNIVRSNKALLQKEYDQEEIFRKAWKVIFPQKFIYHLPWTARPMEPEHPEKQIGGYKALPVNFIREVEDNIWDAWTANKEVSAFANANQAILRWLWEKRVETVWLPNFYEPLVEYLRGEAQIIPVYYECNNNLQPDPGIVNDIGSGQAIITCAWFGSPTPWAFQQALAARPDVHWLEDRRHALHIGENDLAPVVVYSAPDLMGMPDGGILVGAGCGGLDADLPTDPAQLLMDSMKYRAAAYEKGYASMDERLGLASAIEGAFFPSAKCSEFTIRFLKSIKFQPLVEKARENFRILFEAFKEMCFWNEIGDFVPYSFPAIFPNRIFPYISVDIAQSILASSNILCFRKWYPLETQLHNQYHHSGAQRLSQSLLHIPCDWRYDKDDMERIISTCHEEFAKFAANL